MKTPHTAKLVWLLCFLTLLLSQWIFLRGAASILPLEFWDEAVYLRGTFDLPRPYPHWGPAYVYWYAALKMIFSGPIEALFANAALVTALLSWSVFFWLMRLRVHPLAALAGGVWVLLWQINFPVMPKINHFNAAVVLFVGLAITYLRRSLGAQSLVFAVVLFGAAYLRPENFVLAVFFFLVFAIRFVRFKERPARRIWIPALAIVLLIACGLSVYSPFDNRGWPAFVDHYLFVALKNDPTITRMTIENEIFHGAKSIGGAAKNNFPAFAEYVSYNYWKFISISLPHAFFRHYVLIPFFDKGNHFVALGEIVALFMLLLWIACRGVGFRAALWSAVERIRRPEFYFFMLIFLAQVLQSVLVVGLMEAEPRYFLGMLVALVVIFFVVLSRDRVSAGAPITLAVCSLVLLLMPNVRNPAVRANVSAGGGPGFREAVQFLNCELKPGERMFGPPAYSTYAPIEIESCSFNCRFYDASFRRQFEFSRFLSAMRAEQIDWIVVDDALLWNLSEQLPGGTNHALLDGLDDVSCIHRAFSNMKAKIYKIDKQCFAAASGEAASD